MSTVRAPNHRHPYDHERKPDPWIEREIYADERGDAFTTAKGVIDWIQMAEKRGACDEGQSRRGDAERVSHGDGDDALADVPEEGSCGRGFAGVTQYVGRARVARADLTRVGHAEQLAHDDRGGN